jgi:uncharacterized SAM-binding protein YcdF (DUF218 family)
MKRLVVVLGFSGRRSGELHPICAARLERAARLAEGDDAVVLTGWARRGGRLPEAELMRAAWPGPERPFILDTDARTTAENAANAAVHAGELGAREVVVITSSWHRLRTRILFRSLLPGVRVSVVGARTPSTPRLLVREALVFPLVPFQIAVARRRAAALRAGGGAAAA